MNINQDSCLSLKLRRLACRRKSREKKKNKEWREAERKKERNEIEDRGIISGTLLF